MRLNKENWKYDIFFIWKINICICTSLIKDNRDYDCEFLFMIQINLSNSFIDCIVHWRGCWRVRLSEIQLVIKIGCLFRAYTVNKSFIHCIFFNFSRRTIPHDEKYNRISFHYVIQSS